MEELVKKPQGSVHDRFERYLSQHEQKYTRQRREIVEQVFKRKDHFEVENLIDHLRAGGAPISRGTVYSTVKLLVDSGLLKKIQTNKKKVYYEPIFGQLNHDHIICTECGRITEFRDDTISKRQQSIAERHGLTIKSSTHVIYASCKEPGSCPHNKGAQFPPSRFLSNFHGPA